MTGGYPHADIGLQRPGVSRGLIDVFEHRYLLTLIVRKEVQIRYRGSVLGWLWSYVKPLVQFAVFFVALGVFLRLSNSIDAYPLYLLAGMTVISFFTEAFANGTRSLVDNAPLIKKIYVPREMFPVSSMIVAAINTLPQMIVVGIIAAVLGWQPTALGVAAILLGFVIVAVLSTALGMLFGAINVSFRDAQSFVDIIVMCAVWASPVMYQLSMVRSTLPDWAFTLYLLNPLTPAVELFHYGFWAPLDTSGSDQLPELWLFAGIAVVTSVILLFVGQLVFRRLEGRFAQVL
ncbi:ABC transporter permease [Agromyces aureus]|uniref:Transport permease protein n=1 Tax=Agromyces aureus TaxID=453304 RepID=A0A191WHC1_9MICO|nr:ABC transporter permease [Agromyces aureus]ANJ27695.1 sugar ABC transporter permease [Agromyces aureus]